MTDRLHLAPRHRRELEALLRAHLPGVEVWAYGSRATGRSHDGSDLDLALRGPGLREVDGDRLAGLRAALRDSTLPFLVEARDWARLPERFHREIERDHVVLVEGKSACAAGWREAALGACIEINDSTWSPREAWPFVNYLDTGNVTKNRISEIQHLVPGKDRIPSRARRKVRPGEIVYSTVRPNQRHFGLMRDVPENFLASTGFSVIRGREGVACTDFVFWFLAQDHVVELLQTIAETSTSAYPSIRPADIEGLTLDLPPLSEQRAVAQVLGALDDKIEANRRMSATLEGMAQAVFKDWFVDFGPVRAKAAGHAPWLPGPLWSLFPDRLVDSEAGEIPGGWEVGRFGDLSCKSQYGYTASASADPVGPKFLRITDINKKNWINWETVPYCDIDHDDIKKYLLVEGDILIARIADPGHGVMIEESRNAVFASYLIRFRPLQRYYGRYLQYWLRSRSYWSLVRARSTGTTRVSLNAKILSDFLLVMPSSEILEPFSRLTDDLRSRVVTNTLEEQSLGAMRDTLLPKLISGEVRVRGIQ